MSHETDRTITDPSGVPFTELTPEKLRAQRTSIKWTRYPADVLPLFVAEMDFPVAPVVQQAIIDRVRASDTGYLDSAALLAPALAEFALQRWDWEIAHERVFLATDVSSGVVEPLRLSVPTGGRIALSTPAYPGFFEMFEEIDAEIVEIPLNITTHDHTAPPTATARLDLVAIERAFTADPGIDAYVLCNPHNPHGLVHTSNDLTALAHLAAAHNVFIISDEIHAPLTHHGQQFTPFAPIAAKAGALSVTATSASKGWNIAGLKCSVIVAADERARQLLEQLPPEVACRASILGLHANIAAFSAGTEWLDRAVAQIEANSALLAHLLATHLPGVRYTLPSAGYLAWLDFSNTPLASDHTANQNGPGNNHADVCTQIRERARVALGHGESFGAGGAHHVRVNLAVAPATLIDAISRIAELFEDTTQIQEKS